MKPAQEQSNEEWIADFSAKNVSHINPRKVEKPKPARFSTAKEENSLQDDLPLIAPGGYAGRYVRHKLHKDMFGEGVCKLCIEFEVSGNGLSRAVTLEAWFQVQETKTGFSVSKRSKYAHQFFSVFPDSTETRMDRLYPKNFKGLNLELEVRTVANDSSHRPKHKALQYSVVERIIGRKK